MEVVAEYRLHHGPRYSGAGLKVEVHHNQPVGVFIKAHATEEGYLRGIQKGLSDGIELHNEFKSVAIWVTEIREHPVDSSEHAFYRAARLAIEQLCSLRKLIDDRAGY